MAEYEYSEMVRLLLLPVSLLIVETLFLVVKRDRVGEIIKTVDAHHPLLVQVLSKKTVYIRG